MTRLGVFHSRSRDERERESGCKAAFLIHAILDSPEIIATNARNRRPLSARFDRETRLAVQISSWAERVAAVKQESFKACLIGVCKPTRIVLNIYLDLNLACKRKYRQQLGRGGCNARKQPRGPLRLNIIHRGSSPSAKISAAVTNDRHASSTPISNARNISPSSFAPFSFQKTFHPSSRKNERSLRSIYPHGKIARVERALNFCRISTMRFSRKRTNGARGPDRKLRVARADLSAQETIDLPVMRRADEYAARAGVRRVLATEYEWPVQPGETRCYPAVHRVGSRSKP